MKKTVFTIIGLAALSLAGGYAQNITRNSTTTSNSWMNAANWNGTNFPGVDNNSNSTADGSSSNVAVIGATTVTSNNIGINFNTNTSNGVSTNTGANGWLSLGAIALTNTANRSISIGKSDSSSLGSELRLNGATVDGFSNVILSNNSTLSLNATQFQGGSTQAMVVVVMNSTVNNVRTGSSGNIQITANITESGGARKLGVIGDTGATGDVILGGTNNFTGGIDISGTGRLRLTATSALPTTGNLSVSENGRIRFSTAGTYGSSSQTITFNPTGTTNAAFDLQTSDINVTFYPNVALAADTRIEVNGSAGVVTFSGNLSGSGLLLKQAGGNLTLSGTNNTHTGGTQIGNGRITVQSGSSLGTGGLNLFQTSTNDTFIVFNNSAQTISSLSSNFTATSGTQTQIVTLNGTALTVNQTTDTTFGTGAVATLTSSINGTGSLIKSGSGNLTLSSANTYTGGTTINAGSLILTGAGTIGSGNLTFGGGNLDISGITGSTFTMANGTTVSGNGSVNAAGKTLQIAGNLSIGNSPGTLTVTGNFSLAGTANSTFEINGTSAGSFDSLVVSGLLTFGGVLNLSTGYSANEGDSVQLFNAGSYSGTFSSITGTSLGGGLSWDTSSLYSTGVITVIPEPSTALLLLLGGAGLLFRRRFTAKRS